MTIHDRIRTLRKQQDRTQEDVVESVLSLTGHTLTRSYLCDIEKGRTTPSLAMLVKIAAGLGMSLQDFIAPVTFDRYEKVKSRGKGTA